MGYLRLGTSKKIPKKKKEKKPKHKALEKKDLRIFIKSFMKLNHYFFITQTET